MNNIPTLELDNNGILVTAPHAILDSSPTPGFNNLILDPATNRVVLCWVKETNTPGAYLLPTNGEIIAQRYVTDFLSMDIDDDIDGSPAFYESFLTPNQETLNELRTTLENMLNAQD